jgi:hypothetical protein
MIYKKPDGNPLMTYQETLDNRELVKTAIINHEISAGYLQNDLGASGVPQLPPSTNGVPQMAQPPAGPQMSFQPVPQAPAPMSPQQFAQVPAAPQQMMPVPAGYQQQPLQQFTQAPVGVPPMAPQAPAQWIPPQQVQMPMQMPPQQMMQPAPQAPPADGAVQVSGRKRKTAAGNAVAPPPPAAMAPPGFQPQPVPAQQAATPVMQFNGPPPAPQQQFVPPVAQMAPFVPQQVAQPHAQDGGLASKLDSLGKGLEISAHNSDAALKAVAKLQGDVDELRVLGYQILASLHHMYLTNPQLQPATKGNAGTLASFQTFLQGFIGPVSPK